MPILVITTGGTIEGLDYHEEIDYSSPAQEVLTNFFDPANVSFEYSIIRAFSKDSRFITLEDRKLLTEKIKAFQGNKILITHGTISMVETAQYLGKLNFDKTIVLVGSFILGTKENTDAKFNLGYAVHALQTLNQGVYIAMNGKVFEWNNVRKNIIENRFEKLSD